MFRIFRDSNKMVVKIMHSGLQFMALLCGGVGLKAVFRFHNAKGIPNMYTMHSWVGLPTYLMFGLQVSGYLLTSSHFTHVHHILSLLNYFFLLPPCTFNISH